jgi:hypothetical protein
MQEKSMKHKNGIQTFSLLVAILALATLACQGGAGLGPLATETPTPTLTFTPSPTFTPNPTATETLLPTPLPTGAITEEQSDGSTLFTDYDNNFQFSIPEAWLVIPLSSADLNDILAGLSEENPELKEIAATFAQLDPDVIRVMAMNKDMKYSVDGFSTNLTVTAIEDKLMSAMPMDFVTGAVEESLKQGGATIVPNETLAADNANGVEVGVLEFQKTTPTATGASVQAHSKLLIFNAGAKMIMIQLTAPKQLAGEILPTLDQILDTIRLLDT